MWCWNKAILTKKAQLTSSENHYISNNILKALKHKEDEQRKMSDSEEITTALVANVKGSTVYANKAYSKYSLGDILSESCGVSLLPMRKLNSKPPFITYIQIVSCKVAETASSLIKRFLPKSIHITSAKGFELEASFFVLAFSFRCAF